MHDCFVGKMSESKPSHQLTCDVCKVTFNDVSVMETHFSGKKHLKNVRNIDLREQTEGKAVYMTSLGLLKLQAIHEYMSSFGTIVNMIPGQERENPEKLHHVIVEFSGEEAVSTILSKQNRFNHRIGIPGVVPVRHQQVKIYERKFQKRKRSPSPPACPEVKHDQVMMRLSLVTDPDTQLSELAGLLNLDEEEVGKRVNICRNMQKTFSNSGYSHCIVYPFGSSLNGLGFPGCDLDIFMDLELAPEPGKGRDDVPISVTEKQKVRQAYKILSSIPQCCRLQSIINARVPILKFIHRPTGIHCDVSFKNRMSVRNTAYIRMCTEQYDARVRNLLMVIRYIAKHYNLAGGGGGMKMSSYALTMITITYLQQLDNPLLHAVADLQAVHGLQPDIIEGWNCNFCPDLSQLPPLKENSVSLLDLLTGFFQFVASLNLPQVILCPLLGKVIKKTEIKSSFPSMISTDSFLNSDSNLKLDTALCVQDPFELSHNVVRNLPERAVLLFQKFCQEAWRECELVKKDPSQGGICSLFKIELKLDHDKFEKVDISKILSELSPEDSKLFNFSCKLDIPGEYLEEFRDSKFTKNTSDNLLLSSAIDLMDIVFSDCLKLEKSNNPTEAMVTGGNSNVSGRKRSSSDISLTESVAKKVKCDKDVSIVTSNTWSMFHLVWPRRKQVIVDAILRSPFFSS